MKKRIFAITAALLLCISLLAACSSGPVTAEKAQKIALARALYKDAPVVILDEPTAALDPRAEYEMYQQFNSMIRGKTAVFISHRMSSAQFCDRVLVFRGGCLIEEGSHDELMDRNGLYAELYGMQAGYYTK